MSDRLKLTLALFSLLIFILFLCGICCGPRIWEWRPQPKVKSAKELLEPLTTSQIRCIEQITDKDNVVYIEVQGDDHSLAIGYVIPDGYYAAIVVLDQNNQCKLEFQRAFTDLQDYEARRQEKVFLKIQRLELTGDQVPEVYVWLNQYKTGPRGSGRHGFYARQADGTYKNILFFDLCRDWSSVQIIQHESEDRPRIIVTNDERCDWSPDKEKYSEWFLTNDGSQIVVPWQEQ